MLQCNTLKRVIELNIVVRAANDLLGMTTKADEIHELLNIKYGESQTG